MTALYVGKAPSFRSWTPFGEFVAIEQYSESFNFGERIFLEGEVFPFLLQRRAP